MTKRDPLLAQIHIAKKELKLAEEDYRAIILRISNGRTDSSGACTDAQRRQLIEEMKRLGWTGGKPNQQKQPARKKSDKAHVRKVFAIWGDMCRASIPHDPTRAALVSFVKKMTGIDDPEWLNPTQANKVTEALKAWRERETKKKAGAV